MSNIQPQWRSTCISCSSPLLLLAGQNKKQRGRLATPLGLSLKAELFSPCSSTSTATNSTIGSWEKLALMKDGFSAIRSKKNHTAPSNHSAVVLLDIMSQVVLGYGGMSIQTNELII